MYVIGKESQSLSIHIEDATEELQLLDNCLQLYYVNIFVKSLMNYITKLLSSYLPLRDLTLLSMIMKIKMNVMIENRRDDVMEVTCNNRRWTLVRSSGYVGMNNDVIDPFCNYICNIVNPWTSGYTDTYLIVIEECRDKRVSIMIMDYGDPSVDSTRTRQYLDRVNDEHYRGSFIVEVIQDGEWIFDNHQCEICQRGLLHSVRVRDNVINILCWEDGSYTIRDINDNEYIVSDIPSLYDTDIDQSIIESIIRLDIN